MSDSEMTAIQMALRAAVPVQPWPYVESGRRVRLQSGPIAGIEGFLVEASCKQRLIVPLPVLQQSVAVEVEKGWLTPLEMNLRAGLPDG